jgi:hypothetical protein
MGSEKRIAIVNITRMPHLENLRGYQEPRQDMEWRQAALRLHGKD